MTRIPQRLDRYRSGKRLVVSRWCGSPGGDTAQLFWTTAPCVLVRTHYDSVRLAIASEPQADSGFPDLRTTASYAAPMRIAGVAAAPAADGVVVRCEDAAGVRLTTVRGGGVVASVAYGDLPTDVALATNGQRIVMLLQRGSSIATFDDWTLTRPGSWTLAPLRAALGPVGLEACDVRGDGDAVLIATPDSWSRWRWDGGLIEAWRAPPSESLVAWHHRHAVVSMSFDPVRGEPPPGSPGAGETSHLVVWDLASGRGRSLGECRDWPRGHVSHDGRWLIVDRVSSAGRGLELWDLDRDTLVERIATQRRSARALAFSPDASEIGVATSDDLFVLRINRD